MPLNVDDPHLERGIHLSRRPGNAVLGHGLVRDRERFRHSVHRHDPGRVPLLDTAVQVRRDGRRRDEPQRKLRIPGVRWLIPDHRDHGAGSGETRCAAGAHLVGYFARPKCRRQHRRRTDEHRRQHRWRGAEVEQGHRGPQHVALVEFPSGGRRRSRGEQVVPGGGDRFRRPGGTRREEQRRQVPGFARRGVRWGRRRTFQRHRERISQRPEPTSRSPRGR